MPPGTRMEDLTWSVSLKACRASIGKVTPSITPRESFS